MLPFEILHAIPKPKQKGLSLFKILKILLQTMKKLKQYGCTGKDLAGYSENLLKCYTEKNSVSIITLDGFVEHYKL